MASDIKNHFSQILEDTKKKLNPIMINNPKFDELFTRELEYVWYKTDSLDFQVNVSPNGDFVSIISNKPIVDCTLSEFRGNNIAFIKTDFKLLEDNLLIEYNQGVLFDRKLLEKSGFRAIMQYETRFETYYTIKCVNKDGVEYSNSSYIDNYPLNDKSSDINVKEKTLSSFYKPSFYENKLPKASIHMLEASVRNTYRKKGSYAVIHNNVAKVTRDGYKDVNCSLAKVHPLFPDLLRGEKILARTTPTNGKYIFQIQDNYAGSIEELYQKASDDLKKEIAPLKEKMNEKIYNNLLENI